MMTGQYGFVTGYVTLLCLFPYLNRLLQSLSFREYGSLSYQLFSGFTACFPHLGLPGS